MKTMKFISWPVFLAVGLISFIAVRAAADWCRALEEQAKREEDEGGCRFFRHHPSLRWLYAWPVVAMSAPIRVRRAWV